MIDRIKRVSSLAIASLFSACLLGGIPASADDDDFKMSNEVWALLNDPTVREELEISDEQLKKIVRLRDEGEALAEELRDEIRKTPEDGETPDEKRKRISEKAKEYEDERRLIIKDMGKVLLSHQVKRLNQLAMRLRIQKSRKRSRSYLLDPEIRELLEISDLQADKIQKRDKEIRLEVEKKIRRLWIEAEEELQNELSTKQLKILKEVFGEAASTNEASK